VSAGQICQTVSGEFEPSWRFSEALSRKLALGRYALDGPSNTIMAANYKTVLPDAELLQNELEKTRLMLESRGTTYKKPNPQ
jgi:hypothetical protein